MWYTNFWGALPLDISGKSAKKMARFKNNLEFQNFFEKFFTLALELFEWEGLPYTCDERMLERSLLLGGQAMIANVDGALVTLASGGGSSINIYGYPVKGRGYGFNGFNREFRLYVPGADDGDLVLTSSVDGVTANPDKVEAVICYDNVEKYPFINYLLTDCKRLSDLVRSCDVAVHGMKTPYLITCEDSQLKSVKAVLESLDDNVAAVIASKMSVTSDMFHVWPTNMPESTLGAFWEQYCNIKNELLETFGFDTNSQADKRERLLVAEVESNNEEINANLAKRLRQREIFCERVNKVFGTNISVKLRRNNYEKEGIINESHDVDGMEDTESNI